MTSNINNTVLPLRVKSTHYTHAQSCQNIVLGHRVRLIRNSLHSKSVIATKTAMLLKMVNTEMEMEGSFL